jgi:Pro-kumamolisin, activation domain
MQSAERIVFVCAGAVTLAFVVSCHEADSRPGAAEGTAVTSSALTSDGGGGTPAPPTINTFVVYAAQSVTLGTGDHSVGGDIGVATTAGSGPQLTVGSQDQLDVAHTLFAPSISVGNLTQVGAVDTNSLTNNGGQVGTQSAYPPSMPPLPAIFAATPGATNITVAQGHQQTLSPGSFGALTNNGVVFLNPGTYSFSSVSLGNNAQLLAQQGGSTSLLVAGAFATGTQAQVLPVGQPANALTISVSGSDGTNGAPTAASIGASTQIVSLLAAPNGTVSFGNHVQATGAYAGLNCTAGNNVVLNFQSGFANSTPSFSTFVAYATLSMTLGTGNRTIGGDIGVAAVGASSVGTQLVVGSQDVLDPLHTVYAPSVSIGSQAVVGDVDANTLTNSGTIGTAEPYPAGAMPPLPLAIASTPSTTNVTVAQGQQETMNPGSFGALADNGIVFLNPGTYSFSSVSLGSNAQLIAQPGGATSVAIAGTLSTATGAQIFPVGQAAGSLTISVAGNDGTNGSPPAASIGATTQITALLSVPRGTLSFGNNVSATGAFGGFALTTGTNVALNFQSGFTPAAPGQVGQQQLNGYITPAMAAAPLVGPVPASTPMRVGIGLPMQNASQFQTYIQQVSDPTSSTYRQWIDGGTFDNTYGAPASSAAAVAAFATAQGLTVATTVSSNLLIDVSGSAQAINQAFHLNLNYYLRPDGTQFYGPDREPSLDLSTTVLRISGLNNAFVDQGDNSGSSGSAPGPSLSAADLRNAYVPCAGALTGAGQTVGIFSFGGISQTDIAAYQSANGIPPNPPVTLNLNILGSNGPDGETTLDTEMVMAMAPGATIAVFEGPNGGNADDAAFIYSFMATGAINQVTNSWHYDSDDNVRNALAKLAAMGMSNFHSSGDSGAYPAGTEINNYNPFITVVGGTVLQVQGTNGMPCSPATAPCTYLSETGWTGSGGGILDISTLSGLSTSPPGIFPFWPPDCNGSVCVPFPDQPLPSYQAGLATPGNQASSTFRNIPDVSMVSSNVSFFFGCPANATCTAGSTGGTSAASPLWAGFMALANEQIQNSAFHAPVGYANPVLYAVAGYANAAGGSAAQLAGLGFNDIVTGNNGNGTDQYNATAGYDLVTGLGTPTCGLLNQLASTTPTEPFTCPAGTTLCGLTCCDGTCNVATNVCTPPPTFGIQVGALGNQIFGPDVCISGTGFTPNALVTLTISNIPGSFGATSAPVTLPSVRADGTGSFSSTNLELGTLVDCTQTQSFEGVTITATDGTAGSTGTGQQAPASLPACLWCGSPVLCGGGAGTLTCP